MSHRVGIALSALMIGSCASHPASDAGAAAPPLTMASTPELPAGEIQDFYTPDQWKHLQTMPYVGYVLFQGNIVNDRLRIRRIQSFPDHSRDQRAYELLRQVTLKASTVGTHFIPTAAGCVIFYPRELDGALAVIYARQTDYDETHDAVSAKFFRAQLY